MTASTPEKDAGGRVRPFADFLREAGRGTSHDELSEGLRDLVARVEETGKKGSITYKVIVSPLKGDTTTLEVSDKIALDLPEHDRPGGVFYADGDHNLVRNDPRQLPLDGLREVPALDHNDIRDAHR